MKEEPGAKLKQITEPLLNWYATHARELPWRQKEGNASDVPGLLPDRPNPYHVWISEIMLQQTRVEAVKEYYRRFLECLPEVADLAAVPEDELMKLWQGLGYYNRARNLKRAAQIIVKDYNGSFPGEYEQLLTLPGIGEYTAGAIASIAFGKQVPAVDGNVYRIYTRLFCDGSDITKSSARRRIREELLAVIPSGCPGSFNQAWMDLGAVVCLPNGEPLCGQCPLESFCQAKQRQCWQNYPVKPAKKPRKQQERTVLLLEYQGKYLIQRRPDKGLLAGLWEFPSQEGMLSLQQLRGFLRQWDSGEKNSQWPGATYPGETYPEAGVDGALPEKSRQTFWMDIELLGKGEHIFSHVEWHMIGYLVHLKELPQIPFSKDDTVWATVRELVERYSIPSAFRCYYEKIFGIKDRTDL